MNCSGNTTRQPPDSRTTAPQDPASDSGRRPPWLPGGRIHPGLLGKEPPPHNPAPSLRALLFDVPRSVPSGSSAITGCGGLSERHPSTVRPKRRSGPHSDTAVLRSHPLFIDALKKQFPELFVEYRPKDIRINLTFFVAGATVIAGLRRGMTRH